MPPSIRLLPDPSDARSSSGPASHVLAGPLHVQGATQARTHLQPPPRPNPHSTLGRDTPEMFSIDLDAARRERQQPDGLPVILAGEEFTLPAELPLDVFDPFLSEDFDLAGLIRDGIERYKEVGDERGIE